MVGLGLWHQTTDQFRISITEIGLEANYNIGSTYRNPYRGSELQINKQDIRFLFQK
jgi:hypothetical protein